ncbi:hypothetical protein [Marinimicrobium koreense]|jgi:hypothetical protein|uniref:hypothetical protein n=1 Tax=Marinimicrobium koreense TaxID=306545 RepID=UPI003F704414
MKIGTKLAGAAIALLSSFAFAQGTPTYEINPGDTFSNYGGDYKIDAGSHWELSGPITDRWGTLQESYTSPTNNTSYREYDISVGSDVKTFTDKKDGTYSYQLEICTEYLNQYESCNELTWSSDVYVSGNPSGGSSSSSSSSSSSCSRPTFTINSGSTYNSGCDDYYIKADHSLWPTSGPIVDKWGTLKETYFKPDGTSTYRYIEDVSPGVSELILNKASGFYIYTVNRCVRFYDDTESCTGFGHQTFVNVQ